MSPLLSVKRTVYTLGNLLPFCGINVYSEHTKSYVYLLRSNVGKHDNVIKWKHFPRYWPFARGIHRSPVNSPHKDQWRGALMFSYICTRINGWVNNGEAGDLRRHGAHYDVVVMISDINMIYKPLKGWSCVSANTDIQNNCSKLAWAVPVNHSPFKLLVNYCLLNHYTRIN